MRLTAFLPSLLRSEPSEPLPCMQEILDEARELVRVHGDRAFDVAQLKAFQQEAGLVLAISPAGYWDRVADEIAIQRGGRIAERRADFAPHSVHGQACC